MTDDFVTRLGVALRDAADREERRRAPWRALATARTTLPRLRPSLVLATLIAGLILAAAVYGLASFGSDDTAPAGPKVIARMTPAGGLDQIVAGFGSAWLADTDAQTLLRMDPATRRVTARFPLGGSIEHRARARDALWVGLTQNAARSACCASTRGRTGSSRACARPTCPAASGSGGAGDRRRQPLGRERRGGRADRPARPVTPSRRCDTAHNGYRTRSLAVVDGDLWVQISDGRAAAPRRRHRPAQGHLPPARRQPHRGLPDERALRRRREHAVAHGPAHLPRPVAHADRRRSARVSRRAEGSGSRRPTARATAS